MKFERIVSLTPSITETLFALGADQQVIGVTDACDYPFGVQGKPHVCSWFSPDMERITALKPDLVLGLETAHRRLAQTLKSQNIICELFNPATIGDVLTDILRIGGLLDTDSAQAIVDGLRKRLEILDARVGKIPADQRLTTLRVLDVDEDQLIVAGPESFQFDVIARAGGINVTSAFKAAYPKVSFSQMEQWNAAMIFLCGTDERYPARLKADPKWQPLAAVRQNMFYQFDCGLTCRTSPRIVDMAELLFQTLYG